MRQEESIKEPGFTLSLPPGWKLGFIYPGDSYAGEFEGDNTRLRFDYGLYSNSLMQGNQIVTYETIDGKKAKIVIPKTTGKGITGIYIDNIGGSRFNLIGDNLTASQQEIALKIFRTLRF